MSRDTYLLLLAILYLACLIETWGILIGYYCGEYDLESAEDHYVVIGVVSLIQPLGVIMAFLWSRNIKHGLKWK